jgi:hypothetical protein
VEERILLRRVAALGYKQPCPNSRIPRFLTLGHLFMRNNRYSLHPRSAFNSMDPLNVLFLYTLFLMGLYFITGVAVGIEAALFETTGQTYASLLGEARLLLLHTIPHRAGMAFEGLVGPKGPASKSMRYFQ